MLEKIYIFESLNSDEIARLKEISVRKKYKKGEFLFLEGDEPKWLNFLLSGAVRLYKTSPKCKEIFLHQIPPLNFVAEMANFERIAYPATAVFTTGGEVLRIDYQKFYDEFLQKPKIAMEFIKSLTKKIRINEAIIHQELILSSEAKIAKFIAENSDAFDTLKHTQIASILNITPETFSRILNKFKSQNLIKLDKENKILSKNLEKLQEIYKE
ncbi:MAG: Crp/Fnr family transcriptional regulator [Campylobacter sp.]|nr:Crp/Fnr family transcriptional regulator [Campylobacter sp.]